MDLIPVNKIIVGERAREIIESNVEGLMDAISSDGLLHPIVVKDRGDGTYLLVCGGHRLEAYTRLAETDPDYAEVPCTDIEDSFREQNKLPEGVELTKADLLRYEIEENVKRAGMSWTDKVLGLAKYHKISAGDAAQKGKRWTQKLTGDLLGMVQSDVSNALVVAKRLLSSKSDPCWQADSLQAAIRVLVKEKQEAATKLQIDRLKAQREAINVAAGEAAKPVDISSLGLDLPPTKESSAGLDLGEPLVGGQLSETKLPEVQKEAYSKLDLAQLYRHGDALEALVEISKSQKIHHIVTDPPYGIDMENLKGGKRNIGSVEETHKVPENLVLIKEFLQVAFDCIDEKGFLCLWYDLDHHEKIRDWAKKIGWKVCRWPFTWCKSSPCSNQAAAYNFTKATEVCMIFRRSEAAILTTKMGSNYVVSPAMPNPPHPFMKPMSAWEPLIKGISYEGQTIVDPFAGSGSSLYAGTVMNRNMLGIELDEAHIGVGVNWLHKELNAMNIIGEAVI